ncbi:MAG: DUF2735 domain-containing protein [Hyphomicrobiaceae bacterium]
MATSTHIETAKIYQFPLKGRAGADRQAAESKRLAERAKATYADCAFGGNWYHEAALHDVDVVPPRR